MLSVAVGAKHIPPIRKKKRRKFNNINSRRRPIAMMDANIGGRITPRLAMQRTGGERFGIIDGEPRPPSTAAKNVSPIANSESSASASAVGHSKYPSSAIAPTVDKNSRFFIRRTKQTLRKIKDRLDKIDEYECGKIKRLDQIDESTCASNNSQTEEFDVDASLCSSSSFDDFYSSSFNTLSSFPSAAVYSYSALIKEFDDDTRGSQISCATTNSALIKELTFPMTNSESSAAVNALEQSQNPTTTLAVTGRQSDVSTFSSPSFRAFKNFVYDNKKDDELSELVASLQEMNIQQENTIQQLLNHITNIDSKLQSQNESTKVESVEWTHEPSNDPPAQSDDSKDNLYQLQKINDDLAEKIDHLTYENGQLLSKCQQQEKDETLVKDLRAENNDLRALVSGMREELVDFAHVHVDCMKGYETHLASLKDEINRAELAKEELEMKWSNENEKAYQLCEVWQQEVNMLRKALEELRGGGESGSEENKSNCERKY